MSRSRSSGLLAPCSLALVSAVALLAPGGAPAQPREKRESLVFGRVTVQAPERTDAGEWTGTWYYASRDRKVALWVRQRDGVPEIKLRMRGKPSEAENFATDWDGRAQYESVGNVATFELELDERDADTMTGRWSWEVERGKNGRRESADVTIYRAGYGRQMVWVLENVHKESWGRRESVSKQPRIVWLFQKASRGMAMWEELPF